MSSSESSSVPSKLSGEPDGSTGGRPALPDTLPPADAHRRDPASEELGVTEPFAPQEAAPGAKRPLEDPAETMKMPPPEAAPGGPPPVPTSEPSPGSGDDESIEAYMSRLLERVNQGARSADRGPLVQPPGPAKVPSPLPAADPQGRWSSEDPPPPEKPAGRRQPARAPEGRDDLLSLRQLANASAQDALRIHSCKRLVRALYCRLTLAAVAAICSCLLVFLSWSTRSLAYGGAVLAMLIAVVAGWRYLAQSHELAKMASCTASPQRADPTRRGK